MFDNMIEFTKPEGRDRDAVRELSNMKVDMEKTERRLAETRAKLMERNNTYNELWAHKEEKVRILKATESQLEVLKERSLAADGLREAEKRNYENRLKNAKN